MKRLGCDPKIRQKKEQNFISDNGNLIIDCLFNHIPDAEKLNSQLHMIPGVVETGLFLNTMVSSIIAGCANGIVKVIV